MNINLKPDLVEYLNYLVTWDNEKEAHIESMISELNHLLNIGKYHFDADSKVEEHFNELMYILMKVENALIKEVIIEFMVDALAITCISSFGLGMPLLMAGEMEYVLAGCKVSEQIRQFHEKLSIIDLSIVQDMGENVKNYFITYKANNAIIAEKGNFQISLLECRIYLLQFMFEVYTKEGQLDVPTFRKWIYSAQLVHDSQEIKDVSNALKKLDPYGDIEYFIDILSGTVSLNMDQSAAHLVVGLSALTMSYNLKIDNEKIKKIAYAKGIPAECVSSNAFKARETIGSLADNLLITKKIVDQVLMICQNMNMIKQVSCWHSTLFNELVFQTYYKQYFNNIKQASTSFKEALNLA